MVELDGPRWGPHVGRTPRHLVVVLHGVGASGDDLIGFAPALSALVPDAAFVAPHAPEPYDGAPPEIGVRQQQWFSLRDRTPSVLRAGAERAEPPIDRLISSELARLGLPPDAYAIAGFSQGAMTALFAGLRRAVPPRAVLAYSGAMLPGSLDHPRPIRVLLVHGERDEVVPPQRSRDAEAALRQAGLPVEALFRPELGHWLDEPGLQAGAAMLAQAFA